MKNIVYAFIISILIHFLFLFTYQGNNSTKSTKKVDKNRQTQTVRYVKLKPKIAPQKAIAAKKVEPVIEPFLKELKKVEPKKLKKSPKREVIKKPKKVAPKPVPKTTPKKTYKKAKIKKTEPKRVIKKTPKNTKKFDSKFDYLYKKENKSLDQATQKAKKEVLDSFLATPNIGSNMVDAATQSYLDLYSDEELNSMTKVQKVFVEDNITKIVRIMAAYAYRFGLPIETMKRTGGLNTIEFTLFPNGDISNVLLVSSSGYDTFDKFSVKAIEISYQDYPRPKEPTKIRIYIEYVKIKN